MARQTDPLDRILDAGAALIAAEGFATLSLAQVAQAAKVTLAQVYRHLPDKFALLAALTRRADLALLETLPATAEGEVPRDRLFDVLMGRFEHLASLKEVLRVVYHDLRRSPFEAMKTAPALFRAMNMLADAVGVDVAGMAGAARVRLLAGVYASVLPVWLHDDDPGLAKTMAALDRRLRRMEKTWPAAWGTAPGRRGEPDSQEDFQGTS